MNYFDEINKIENSYFTIESFMIAKKIINNLNKIYNVGIINNDVKMINQCKSMIIHLKNIVFQKLHEKLASDSMIINKIIKYLDSEKNISDIFIIDDSVVANVVDINNNCITKSFIDGDNFHDIISNTFNNTTDNVIFKKLIVFSINNMFRDYVKDDILTLEKNNDISYNLLNTQIYLNNNLYNINYGYNKVIKILIKHNNKLFYCDMKFRNDYLIISQNDYEVDRLSEKLLDNKKKLLK